MAFVAAVKPNQVVFNCEYKFHTDWPDAAKTFYSCSVKNLAITEPSILTGVSQTHLSGKSNKEVEVLQIKDQICDYLPEDIDKFFPNLKGFSILQTKLKTIKLENLAPFPNLFFVQFALSDIRSLEWDLFTKTPFIQYISLTESPIAHLGPGLFEPLNNLQEIHFTSCKCISKNVQIASQIEEMKRALEANCPPTLDMTQRALFSHDDALEKRMKAFVKKAFNIQ